MTRDNFIGKVVNELLTDGFSVLLTKNGEHHHLGGSFNGHDKEFITCLKGKLGFEVLVHEYCHYRQWKERKRFYNRLVNGCSIVFDWLDGKSFKQEVLDYAFSLVIELERDCEERAIELIKKHNLDVDIERYCKAANAYILFYHMVRETRKWSKGKLYSQEIIRSMPTEILDLEFYLDSNNIKDHQRKKYIKILG